MIQLFRSLFEWPTRLTIQSAVLLVVASIPAGAWGAAVDSSELSEALSRMKTRQAEVEKILLEKQAGERNDGLLEPMSNPPEATAKRIEEENRDREIVYAELAKASASSPETVKQHRAERLRERLLPGIWRMVPADESNKWEWSLEEATDRVPPRLLTRPGASLFDGPDGRVETSGIENFTMYEVMERKKGKDDKLWYQVGERGGTPIGWIREDEAMEWFQSLVMQFTPQRDRNRVLYFDDKEELRHLAELPGAERATELSRMISAVKSGGDPGHSIIAMEPEFDPGMQEIPVIIPILDHEVITLDGVRETRLLRLAAATRSQDSSQPVSETTKSPEVDVVFVVDTTSSMGPYLEKTKEAVTDFASGVGGSAPTVRFGIVAYRDSDPAYGAQMEYSVRNYTPSLVSASELVDVLSNVKAMSSDPGDPIPEDVFSGVDLAIRSAWRNAPGVGLRFIILVGDASGNEPYTANGRRNPGNESGLDRKAVRELLSSNRIELAAVHIRDPKYRSDHAKAETDFSALATNDGSGPRYSPVDFQPESFGAGIRIPFAMIQDALTKDTATFIAGAESLEANKEAPLINRMFAGLFANAYAEWVVGQNIVPLDRDFKGWVIPNDLSDPTRKAMDVRLMLKRVELQNLKRKLDQVLDAAKESTQTGGDFFDDIQVILGAAVRDPSASQSGNEFDLPNFIKNLPYRSRILGMHRGQWETMSEADKTLYINDWKGMSDYYGRLLQDQGLWKNLSPAGEDFVMVLLEMLP